MEQLELFGAGNTASETSAVDALQQRDYIVASLEREYIDDYQWIDFEEDVQAEFEQHEGKLIHISYENMGWRNACGEATFTLRDACQIYENTTPNCDWCGKIEKYKDGSYLFTVYHHDSPCGEFIRFEIGEEDMGR